MGVLKVAKWTVIGVVGVAVLGAILPKPNVDPSIEIIAAGRLQVKERLKDPESAQFGDVWTPDTSVFCGYVNSKNALGGYTGKQLFYGFGTLVYFDSDLRSLTSAEQKLPLEIRAKCEGKR